MNKVIKGIQNSTRELFKFGVYNSPHLCTLGTWFVVSSFLMENILWFAYLRRIFEGNFAAYRWYTLHPTILSSLAIIMFYFWRKLEATWTNKSRGFSIAYKLICCTIFCVYYASFVFFYQSFPTAWCFMIAGLLLVAIQGDGEYIVFQTGVTVLAYSLIESGITSHKEFMLASVSHAANLGITIWILLVFACFVFGFYIQTVRNNRDKKQAYDADKAKSSFLASMSHEIRTPINAVLGMNEMILREDINESVEQYAMNIQSAGQSLLALINDILDFSKIESGKMEFINAPFHVSSLINDSYNIVNYRAVDKGLDLRVSCNPAMPSKLNGDAARIRQCMVNILTNAIKYTKQGYVELHIDYDAVGKNEINLKISVKDTGVGIEEEELKNLFQAFTRIDEKANRNVEGTGLGLSITKSMVEGMGGTIHVESKKNVGSCFTISIKLAVLDKTPIGDFNVKTIRKASTAHERKEKFIAPNAVVLVVDDVPMNLDVMKGLLKRTKVKVDVCESGEEAIDKVIAKKYDIIFMDHLMPGMDGIETLRKMKTIKHLNKSTPVIALTANAIVGVEEEYKAEGFTDYLSKPVESATLEDMVMHYLPKELIETVKFENSNDLKAKREMGESMAESNSEIIERLNFLDTKTGLVYVGNSEDLYVETIRIYVKDRFDAELDKALAEEDLTTYQRVAHSIKSSSGMIGASDLFTKAKELEMAAKAGDLETIKSKHESVMADYRELLGKLEGI